MSDMASLKFTKLHSPKMKSVYWKYFGFPTNENDCIITKQNVVCVLCHKVLTNHGNTTNLRAHLQHRHDDIFKKICAENGIRVPPRKPQIKHVPATVIKRKVPDRKIKVEFQENNSQDSSNPASITNDDQSMLYATMVPITYEDDDVIDADHFTKVEVGGGLPDLKCSESTETDTTSATMYIKDTAHFRMDIEDVDSFQLQDALITMVVQDLRNVDTLYDTGMMQLIRTFSGNVEMPSNQKIESLIKELHSDKLTTLADQIKVHSQVKPFSLGFEIWSNVEQKQFLSIYYNYTTEAPDYDLMNQLYCTLEYNKYTAIDTVFNEFNLQNCTAAIVSYDYGDYLKDFFQQKSIPIILSFDVTVDKCLRNIFSLPSVASILEMVKDVVARYATEIALKDVEIPVVIDDFPWTSYELLKFFTESVSWPDDDDVLVDSVKSIAETLNILAVTLDTLKGEAIPHSSMLSPITAKILSKKLAPVDTDDELVRSMKSVVVSELEKLVIADDHLTISALLDPRFHRLTNIDNLSGCLKILTEKANKFNKQDNFNSSSKQMTLKPLPQLTKRSNLELFFDIQDSVKPTTNRNKSNVENDLKRYRNEVFVNLDESPFLWWNKMGHLYGSLKYVASFYQCVPCVVNMNFKKPIQEQIHGYQKRFMLKGSLIDAILFLHHNGKASS